LLTLPKHLYEWVTCITQKRGNMQAQTNWDTLHLENYVCKWVAISKNRIVASGRDAKEVFEKAWV